MRHFQHTWLPVLVLRGVQFSEQLVWLSVLCNADSRTHGIYICVRWWLRGHKLPLPPYESQPNTQSHSYTRSMWHAYTCITQPVRGCLTSSWGAQTSLRILTGDAWWIFQRSPRSEGLLKSEFGGISAYLNLPGKNEYVWDLDAQQKQMRTWIQ